MVDTLKGGGVVYLDDCVEQSPSHADEEVGGSCSKEFVEVDIGDMKEGVDGGKNRIEVEKTKQTELEWFEKGCPLKDQDGKGKDDADDEVNFVHIEAVEDSEDGQGVDGDGEPSGRFVIAGEHAGVGNHLDEKSQEKKGPWAG